MFDTNITLENAIQKLEERDNAGTLTQDWQRVLKWLYELLGEREAHEREREYREDERWD